MISLILYYITSHAILSCIVQTIWLPKGERIRPDPRPPPRAATSSKLAPRRRRVAIIAAELAAMIADVYCNVERKLCLWL